VCINPLPSDRLRCCDRYIRCQRSLAVKPLTMSGSPSPCVEWAGLRLPMYRHQTAAARCARWQQIDVDARKQQLCVGRPSGRCASNGAFSTGVKRDCGLLILKMPAGCILMKQHMITGRLSKIQLVQQPLTECYVTQIKEESLTPHYIICSSILLSSHVWSSAIASSFLTSWSI